MKLLQFLASFFDNQKSFWDSCEDVGVWTGTVIFLDYTEIIHSPSESLYNQAPVSCTWLKKPKYGTYVFVTCLELR